MYKSLILVIILLCQPLLDSFDVASNNDAFHLTTHLLESAQILEAHCQAEGDHTRHQLQHDELSAQLSEAAADAHCHICHLGHIVWPNKISRQSVFRSVLNHTVKDALVDNTYKVTLRPPIA